MITFFPLEPDDAPAYCRVHNLDTGEIREYTVGEARKELGVKAVVASDENYIYYSDGTTDLTRSHKRNMDDMS